MKNLITISFLFLLSTMIGKTSKDSLKCLTISGKIGNIAAIQADGEDKTYKVELIYYNTVIDSIIQKNNKTFKFSLKRNSMYTIRISKKGYITRLVSINTSVDDWNNECYYFHFDTDLLKENMKEVLDEEALEFPITIVSFNEDENIFHYNKEYTTNIKKTMFFTNKQ